MSLNADFQRQSEACAALGSPFMGQLMALCADRLTPDRPLTTKIFNLPGALGPEAASIPLRLAGALHALKLGGHSGLSAVYPPNAVDDAALWAAVTAALDDSADFIDAFLENPPQTNEVRRSACMIAAATWLRAEYPMPLVLSELGASAGLNLMFEKMALLVGDRQLGASDPAVTLQPDWTGTCPEPAPLQVSERRGVDLKPVLASDPAQKQRLLSYLWPDQPDRIERTEAILGILEATVDAGDAADWLARRELLREGHLHLIYHTIAWQYFPAETQARATRTLEDAGRKATPNTPLAWLAMEWDGDEGAAMTLRLWPGDRKITLGRIDFHGRWVNWQPVEGGPT